MKSFVLMLMLTGIALVVSGYVCKMTLGFVVGVFAGSLIGFAWGRSDIETGKTRNDT